MAIHMANDIWYYSCKVIDACINIPCSKCKAPKGVPCYRNSTAGDHHHAPRVRSWINSPLSIPYRYEEHNREFFI